MVATGDGGAGKVCVHAGEKLIEERTCIMWNLYSDAST